MAFWPPAKGEFLRGRRTALFESAGLRYVSDAAWIAPIAKPLSPRVGSLENRDSCPDGFADVLGTLRRTPDGALTGGGGRPEPSKAGA